MRVVPGNDYVVRWVASRQPFGDANFGPHASLAVIDQQGNILGGVVYHDFTKVAGMAGGNIFATIAAENARWLSRGVLAALFHYPFEQLGCHRMTVIVAKKNRRSRKLAEGLGFKHEGVLRKFFVRDDAIILSILKSEAARWLPQIEKAA